VQEANTVATGLSPGHWLPARARRGRGRAPRPLSTAPTQRIIAVSRLIVACAGLAVAAVVLATGAGYRLAGQSDERLVFEQHAALRTVIAEFQPSLREAGMDPRLIGRAEQIAGVKNVKFTSDPDKTAHEMQPVVTADGRIVGFFVWDSSRPMTNAMNRLVLVAVSIAFVLLGWPLYRFCTSSARGGSWRSEKRTRRARLMRTSSQACRTIPRRWSYWTWP
jgi:hypothetical protein